MTGGIELKLPVPYRERVRTRTRTFVERTAFAMVGITVPTLPARGLNWAPPGFRHVLSARLGTAEDVDWLDDGNGPMRPLLSARPGTGGGRIAYGLADRHWWDREGPEDRPEGWSDYPFPGWSADDPEIVRVRGEVVATDLVERIEKARAIAGTMAYGFDRLYRRAALPAWTVEDLRGGVPGMTRISLILPDIEKLDVGGRQPRGGSALGLFGPGEKDAALRVSHELFGSDAWMRVGSRRRRVRDQAHWELAFPEVAVDALPVEAAGTLRICRRIVREMAGRDAWEMGGDDFEAAVAGFEAAASKLSAAVEAGPAGVLVDALDGLAEATGRAADVLSREAGTDAEVLFLFRTVTATRTSRTPIPRYKPTLEDVRCGRWP